ncbi:MAG: hypothetical protein JWO89_405 [Verrucomicrobiaceae bacterium]|nr:hypothetical protein [Verrucomicrobiaceae bacterium]
MSELYESSLKPLVLLTRLRQPCERSVIVRWLEFKLSLKDCGINVPSKLLIIRVGDTIKLHASVKLKRAND